MADPVHPDTGADVEMLVEQRLAQYREVPGLLEWDLPLGTAWLRLLAEGRPLTIQEIRGVLGWRPETITRRLARWDVEPDREGTVTVVESEPGGVPLPRYSIRWLDTGESGQVPGCTADALIPVLLAARPARIELPCPATGQPVRVELGHGGTFHGAEPSTAVATMPAAASDWHPGDWTRSDCANGLVFASAADASNWLASHPGHTVVPVWFFVRLETRFFARALAEAARDETGERPA